MRARVVAARDRQRARLAKHGVRCNAELTSAMVRDVCRLDDSCERVLAAIVARRATLTARSIDRLLKVSRTIADLGERDAIDADCLREAAAYRGTEPSEDLAFAPSPDHKEKVA